MKIDSLVVGAGEVGSAIFSILYSRKTEQTCKMIDIKDVDFDTQLNAQCETLHICFPYSNTFSNTVIEYIQRTNAALVIIHSTVQVGTTKEIDAAVDAFVVHSPVQGQHPDLTDAILYFEKLVGTESDAAFEEVKKEFPNLTLVHIKNPDATELGKMLSTSYYGVCIAWHREMKRMCDMFGTDFEDTVTKMNLIYNKGYAKFKPEAIRPVLIPPSGSIGGHCIVQNAILLENRIKSDFLDLIW